MNDKIDYKELRRYLSSASDDFSFEEAISIKDQYLPEKIYKYRECNERNIDNFRKDIIYCANPSRFDDAYSYLILPDKRLFFKDTIENIIEENQEDGDLLYILETYKNDIITSSDPISYFASLFSKNKEMTIRKLQGTINILINETKRIAYRGIGISCFSDTIDSATLWSQYANEETGFALSYDLEHLDIRSNIWPVLYSPEELLHKLANTSNTDVNILKILISVISKTIEHEYEHEWRLIINERHLQDEHVMHLYPDAIYLGAKMNENNKEKLVSLAQKKGIDIFLMQPSDIFFQEEREKHNQDFSSTTINRRVNT